MRLHAGIRHRHLVPMALGSGKAGLVYEMQAMYHQLYMETGSSKVMGKMGLCTVAFTSDRGTERGLCMAPPVQFGDLFHNFCVLEVVAKGDAADRYDVESEDVLHMPFALPASGGLHLVNNIAKGLVLAMPRYDDRVYPLLTEFVNALHEQYVRDRFKETCLLNSQW